MAKAETPSIVKIPMPFNASSFDNFLNNSSNAEVPPFSKVFTILLVAYPSHQGAEVPPFSKVFTIMLSLTI